MLDQNSAFPGRRIRLFTVWWGRSLFLFCISLDGYWFGAGKYLRGWRINVSVSVTWKKIEVFHGTFLQRTM